MTRFDTLAAAILACFFSAFLAFAVGRTFRSLVPDERKSRSWWAAILLITIGSAGGWAIFRVALRILVNAMGGAS
jgi:multisubunit Na+/H+ antiporter MnhE subunit